jgi:hypothetical protein
MAMSDSSFAVLFAIALVITVLIQMASSLCRSYLPSCKFHYGRSRLALLPSHRYSEFKMHRALLSLVLLPTIVFAEQYGAPIAGKNALSLPAAIALLRTKASSPVLIESKVDKICVVKGCWLGLVDAKNDVRVTFKDYAFFVPASLIGKTVIVEGVLEKVTMTLEETKHYVKDAGGDPATVTQPRVEYRIVASGVEVKS